MKELGINALNRALKVEAGIDVLFRIPSLMRQNGARYQEKIAYQQLTHAGRAPNGYPLEVLNGIGS